MSNNEKIRTTLTYIITTVVLSLGILTATFPIYLEVIKSLMVPFGVVLTGYFGVHAIKNNKKIGNEQINEK